MSFDFLLQLKDTINPIFIAYAALTLMALMPIYFGSFLAIEEIKVKDGVEMNLVTVFIFRMRRARR